MIADATLASVGDVAGQMISAIERMIAIQMTAYPAHWNEEERRDSAMRYLKLKD